MTTLRLCNHTKSDGSSCLAPARHSSPRCRHHQRQAARDHRRALALNSGRTVRLGQLDSRPAILRYLNKIIQLLAAGTLPADRAGLALYRINLALAAIHQREGATQNESSVPQPALSEAVRPSRTGLEEMWVDPPPRPQMSKISVDDLLNSFTASFNPFTLDLEFTAADLPSHIHPPTIEKTPAIRHSSQPAVHNHSHRPSRQRPPAYPDQPPATDNEQRRTDNATT